MQLYRILRIAWLVDNISGTIEFDMPIFRRVPIYERPVRFAISFRRYFRLTGYKIVIRPNLQRISCQSVNSQP